LEVKREERACMLVGGTKRRKSMLVEGKEKKECMLVGGKKRRKSVCLLKVKREERACMLVEGSEYCRNCSVVVANFVWFGRLLLPGA
jgi:hypothetical protein